MAEIGLYDRDGTGVPPAQRVSYKLDAPMADFFAWEPRENKLVQRVKEAREAGMSYGCYMAMLYEEEVKERARKSENRTNRAGPDAAADG